VLVGLKNNNNNNSHDNVYGAVTMTKVIVTDDKPQMKD